MQVAEIPSGMTPHIDDSGKFGYPPGVGHDTMVEVIITYQGKFYFYRGLAQQFGWMIDPAPSSVPGVISESAPITHYRIVEESGSAAALVG